MEWSTFMTNIQWAERTHAGESSNSLVTPGLSLPPILYGKPKHREAKQLAQGCGWYMTEPEFKPDWLALEATSLTLHLKASWRSKELELCKRIIHRRQWHRQERAWSILSKCRWRMCGMTQIFCTALISIISTPWLGLLPRRTIKVDTFCSRSQGNSMEAPIMTG